MTDGRCNVQLSTVYNTLWSLRDLAQILNSWKVNKRKNQVLCVPLNDSHPNIVLFHV